MSPTNIFFGEAKENFASAHEDTDFARISHLEDTVFARISYSDSAGFGWKK